MNFSDRLPALFIMLLLVDFVSSSIMKRVFVFSLLIIGISCNSLLDKDEENVSFFYKSKLKCTQFERLHLINQFFNFMQNLLVLSKNWLSYSPETIRKLCVEDGQDLEPKAYLRKQINETSSKNGLGIRIENYSHLKLEMDSESNEFTDIDPFKEYLFDLYSNQSIHDSVSWKVKLDPEKSHSHKFVLTYDEPYK